MNRVLFYVFERALENTGYDTITQLFKGTVVNKMICKECGPVSNIIEPFLDLVVQVKNIKSLHESLKVLTTFEELAG